MINLNLTEAQLDELHQEVSDNWFTGPKERLDRLPPWERPCVPGDRRSDAGGREHGHGIPAEVRRWRSAATFGRGLPPARWVSGQPRGVTQDAVREAAPHTVNHAIERIEQETGLRLQPSAGRELLHKLGLKPRCCGWVPGKALEDGAQQRAPQEFHDRTRQPMLEEAQRGQRVIRFVATAHFVMGAFLGILGCLARQQLPSSSGRRRDNVLGADDPIRHEVITLTNDTVVNPETFCALRDKIATAYAGTGHPITRVLDNAHYPKCPAVFAKAQALGIKLLYVPAYSPNLNLSERFWRFVKKQVLTVPTTARSPPSRKASTVVCATSAPASNARCKH